MDHRGDGCGKDRTFPVCSKAAGNTSQGLCDMVGNVWEWTEDCWHGNYNGAPTNGGAWSQRCSTFHRVSRGGNWYSPANKLRVAYRGRNSPGFQDFDLGIRCAK